MLAICAAAAAAAVVGLLQLWWAPFSAVVLLKVLTTIVILGVLIGFVAAIKIDMTGGRTRIIMLALMALAGLCAFLFIAQMWWMILNPDIFGKIVMTLLLLAGLGAFFMATAEDFGTTKKLKDENYID